MQSFHPGQIPEDLLQRNLLDNFANKMSYNLRIDFQIITVPFDGNIFLCKTYDPFSDSVPCRFFNHGDAMVTFTEL